MKKTKTVEKVRQLTPDEMSYHQTVLTELQRAQVAAESWGKHLTAKYELTKDDVLGLDGTIIRKTEDAAPTE